MRDGVKDGPLGEDQAESDGHDDRRVTQREPVAEGERTTRSFDAVTFVEEFASGVVNRRDVVGVKGVAKTQGVGEDPETDSETHVVAG